MKKLSLLLFIALAGILVAFTIAGCSTGSMSGAPSPPIPTEEPVGGDWAGSWSSYQTAGLYGMIDPLSFTELETPGGTSTLTGDMTITGLTGTTGSVSGSIQGTVAGSTVNFNVSLVDGPTLTFEGTLTDININGTYIRYDGGQQTDTGNFYLTKKL